MNEEEFMKKATDVLVNYYFIDSYDKYIGRGDALSIAHELFREFKPFLKT